MTKPQTQTKIQGRNPDATEPNTRADRQSVTEESKQDQERSVMLDEAMAVVAKRMARLAKSGAIDRSEPAFNKALLCAALRDVSDNYMPFGLSGRAAVKNLLHF